MTCNTFSGMIYYAIILSCYVTLRFMFSDIFRTCKMYFIFIFKDTNIWGRLTPIGSNTWWDGMDFLFPHVQLLRHYLVETRQPSQGNFLHRPTTYIYIYIYIHIGIYIIFVYIYIYIYIIISYLGEKTKPISKKYFNMMSSTVVLQLLFYLQKLRSLFFTMLKSII